ncbi:hypothetical protein GQ55_7G124600 [Panicum hallii var. hallii]|uniref:Uncharacterized protein n=1 Tax=Panicum hallii var. hallii TaxID=1504633 RepID=A0A2T7CUD4_9POAL|nr:hypothetical protein GQ55_7G124600 [Panicum hallii var. hallii]
MPARGLISISKSNCVISAHLHNCIRTQQEASSTCILAPQQVNNNSNNKLTSTRATRTSRFYNGTHSDEQQKQHTQTWQKTSICITHTHRHRLTGECR